MEKPNLTQLSQLANASKSTVSKALNNCFGVDGRTRENILALARQAGYEPPRAAADVTVILPDTPAYFWRRVYEALLRAQGALACRYNVYSALHNRSTANEYLVQAEKSGAAVVIAAVSPDDEMLALLRCVQKKSAVLFLGERVELTNAFYIGEDAYAAGALLGRQLLAYGKAARAVCLMPPDGLNARLRADGFFHTVTPAGVCCAGTITLTACSPSPAALLARQLEQINGGFDCVFCADGVLPDVCLAVEKLRLQTPVVCLGFENPAGNGRYFHTGRLLAAVEQDVEAQAFAAMQFARDYIANRQFPEQKNQFISSRLVNG